MRFWHSTLRTTVNRLLEMTQKVILKQLFCHRLSLRPEGGRGVKNALF